MSRLNWLARSKAVHAYYKQARNAQVTFTSRADMMQDGACATQILAGILCEVGGHSHVAGVGGQAAEAHAALVLGLLQRLPPLDRLQLRLHGFQLGLHRGCLQQTRRVAGGVAAVAV